MRQMKSLAIIILCILFLGILIQFEIRWMCIRALLPESLNTVTDNLRSVLELYEDIWKDIKYFPVPLSTKNPDANIQFENSWLFERRYGGSYAHEGTDLMPDQNIAGRYPVVSMTDGIIEKIGWLEKGGYRIGIRSIHGVYFYYAHLASYAEVFKTGDTVKAGTLIGYMGDSGYGPEGTTGMFPVHLHVGIYLRTEVEEEVAVNPYWFLRYLETSKLRYAYE